MVTKAVGLKRLEKLADYLMTVPAKSFDFMEWGCAPEGVELGDHPTCGTVACALGHATAIRSFRRAGLKLSVLGDSIRYDYGTDTYVLKTVGEVVLTDSAGNTLRTTNAASVFFAIPKPVAESFFLPSGYQGTGDKVTAEMVAKKIRDYVKQERKALASNR